MDNNLQEIVLNEEERKHAKAMKEGFEAYEKIQEIAEKKNIKLDFGFPSSIFLKKDD
jgi:hypothetical protein